MNPAIFTSRVFNPLLYVVFSETASRTPVSKRKQEKN